MEATSLVEVDAAEYPVHFQGFHQPLQVWLADGRQVSIRPWTCGEHLAALGRHARPGSGGVELDLPAFCGEVLARDGLQGAVAQELEALALWWAAGGGDGPGRRPGADGWLQLASCRVRLRPWTAGERQKALGSSLRREGEARSLDVARHLEAMLEASVVSVEPAGADLRALDSADTMALLEALVAQNTVGLEERDQLASPDLARVTLRLCRELGWTPSQVWATPAPEVDRLLALLDACGPSRPALPAGPPAPVTSPRGGIADHPDAIVIRIEDPRP